MITDKQVENFLKENGSGITKAMGELLLKSFGSMQSLITNYINLKAYGADNDETYTLSKMEMVQLFEENRDEFLSLLSDMVDSAGYDSIVEYVEDMHQDESYGYENSGGFNYDEVAKVLFVERKKDSEMSDCWLMIGSFVVWAAVEQFVLAWEVEKDNNI
ncbi:MAG: hypothetical protein VYA60_09620 [Pseudomonadota bacterium]|nr:hypothetical protein [Pseudomonadota bacterium]